MWLLENGKLSLWFTLTAGVVFLPDSVAMDAAISSGVCWASAHICHCAHLCMLNVTVTSAGQDLNFSGRYYEHLPGGTTNAAVLPIRTLLPTSNLSPQGLTVAQCLWQGETVSPLSWCVSVQRPHSKESCLYSNITESVESFFFFYFCHLGRKTWRSARIRFFLCFVFYTLFPFCFVLFFTFKICLLRHNFHTIKCNHFKYRVQWVLTNDKPMWYHPNYDIEFLHHSKKFCCARSRLED